MRYILKNWKRADAYKSLFLIFSVLLFVGCANPAAYREPITRFQVASIIVIEGARVEYKIANKRERDAMIDKHVASREKISLKDLNDNNITVLSPEALKVRMAALDAISKHCQLLLALASSDAPQQSRRCC